MIPHTAGLWHKMIQLYELDLSSIGEGIFYFHAGLNGLLEPVVWQGQTYQPIPIMVSGFEVAGDGTMPRPQVTVSNAGQFVGALVRAFDDLVNCKFVRHRTYVKYLDAVNFADGNAEADPTAEFNLDIYFIDRKITENKLYIEFELASAMDLQNVMIPMRNIQANTCGWRYRGDECGYTGTDYFDALGNPVVSANDDICSQQLATGCKPRFGATNPLPFGGFPSCSFK